MKIRGSIPNFITSLNLLCGVLAVTFSFRGEEIWAVYCVLAAALFDFLDGFSARLLKAYSPMGKELDSLADLISFGMVPAVLIMNRYERILGVVNDGNAFQTTLSFLSYFPLIIVLFSALRLAKFNIDTRQSSGFIGLPTPANALLIIGLIHFTNVNTIFETIEYNLWFWPFLSLILSILLVAEIPMFSLKFKSLKWRENITVYSFIIFGLFTAVIFVIFSFVWSGWVALIFISYIIFNLLNSIICRKI
ncbi:MAG: CDP-diacylglycerol--serine O-phosphatidyltransferase [Bacteroidales bacterium]